VFQPARLACRVRHVRGTWPVPAGRRAVRWPAAKAAGLALVVAGVAALSHSLADESSLRADIEHAIALGFTGKLCIHPRQIAVTNQLLSPSDADITWASQIVAAARDGSVTVHDGQMIDRPVVLRTQALLARASLVVQERQAP
jgi:citrate lyase subunit beta/citryl-CoA lyase